MPRSYLDKENQHILTHTKDNRVNSFIANVNELVRHVDDIFYANTIFNQDVVDVLREALDTDFTELLKDLKKGNHLGNRQLDINLLKNMDKWNEYLTEEEQKNIWLDVKELVYYDSALVKFTDGTTHRIIFQFDGVEGPITTHGDLLLQFNNDEEFLAKLEKTSANTFPAKVVGEYLKLYDELGQNSNVEGVELNAVSGKYKEKNPYYYWIATTSALQVLAMRSTEIIKLGAHIDKVVSLALNVDQMLELQNRLPQLVDTYDHLAELLEIYSKLDYLLDVVNLAEAAENSASMAEQFADEALTRLNKIQSIKVGRTITTTPNNEAVVFYNSDSNEFTFTVPKGEKGDRGDPFQVKASGTMEQRALYDDRPKGFSFLCIDTSEVFFRKSDTHADWTVGVPFGKGDKGDKGDKGEDGRTPKLSDSIDSASSLTAASSKAIKTVNDKWSAIGTAAMRDVGTEPNEIPTNSVLGSGTAASWSADGAPYPISAQVYHDGKQWLALRANSVEPVEGDAWTELVGKQYVDIEVTGANNYTDTRVDAVAGQLSTDYYQGAYGISWDYVTDTYIRTGAKGHTSIQSQMKRCVMNADGTVNYYLDPSNSNFKEDGTASVLTGADGNVMVEIPKHYIKVETVDSVDNFSVSLTPEPEYVLDPSFLKWNGTEMVEVPYRYFRAYEGFVRGGKLLSVSGVTPTRSQTISVFRGQARANGDGWHLTDWNLLNTIKRLCYIEFCDFIVTKYLGEGNHIGEDYGITTGQSNALGNRSSNNTYNNKYMTYRGIENMYADIWEFVDGVNVTNYQFYVNGNYSTFQSDVFTGNYVSKGPLTAAGSNDGLIKRCAVSADGGFIPTVVGGSTATFYGDALWSATGARVALYGGHAAHGASGGLGALRVGVHDASSNSNGYIGAAVCR